MLEGKMAKKVLVIRLGALGDMIMITPAIKRLKEMGYYVVLNTNKRGRTIFENNPNVDEIIDHDESMHIDDLPSHWDKLREQVNPDKFVNFSESIECNVALHPIQPQYNYTKLERRKLADRNYYDVTEQWAGLEGCQKLPELYFTSSELAEAKSHIHPGKLNILWQLSGSAKQKVYPWADYVIGEILKEYPDVYVITTGDEKCQLLESLLDERIVNLSGRIPARIAMCLTGSVDLVISPDTGVLHASGCYQTPKIGLLGHTTIENITKYFINDYSIEAQCACAPCFRLIYEYEIQCPIESVTRAAWCMAEGFPPERVYARIKETIGRIKTYRTEAVPALRS
jgi:ADP-heptose:LPS heptosyltransferase